MSENEKYLIWKNKQLVDLDLNKELDSICNKSEEINDRFYKDLTFGTGGLRGIIGAGTNRINIYTIAKVTQGLANYINKKFLKAKVAIAYDSRVKSELFAKETARVLAANKIKVFMYKELMPTPALSFAVRHLKCQAGVVITASHNPAEYNGYKVYGADGCQITDNVAKEISKHIAKSKYFGSKIPSLEKCLSIGKIVYSSVETQNKFLSEIKALKAFDIGNISVTYTPLHGTGRELIPTLLEGRQVGKLSLVEEQMTVDGNFPTCPYPNPEKAEALTLGIKQAEKDGSDILIATDPDADRIGVAVKTENSYQLLSGNETGALLCDYFLSVYRDNG